MGFFRRVIDRVRGRRPKPDDVLPPPEPAPAEGRELPGELLWLLDAPMFIDTNQVEAFYDAVLRPDYEGASLTLSDSVTRGVKVGGEATIGAAIPWLVKGETKVTGETERSRALGQEATLNVVSNPYRHLLALAIHYATEKNDRLVLRRENGTAKCGDADMGLAWTEDGFIRKSPRALLLIDFPPGTKLIPAALELEEGQVVPVLGDFADRLTESGEEPPKYPGSDSGAADREKYWQWFVDRYNDRAALETVEKTMQDGHKLAWIDFRVPLAVDSGPMMHLHIVPRGQYETGAFAYNFISRGFKHGIRLVGTLKSEPDLNVLAIFER